MSDEETKEPIVEKKKEAPKAKVKRPKVIMSPEAIESRYQAHQIKIQRGGK